MKRLNLKFPKQAIKQTKAAQQPQKSKLPLARSTNIRPASNMRGLSQTKLPLSNKRTTSSTGGSFANLRSKIKEPQPSSMMPQLSTPELSPAQPTPMPQPAQPIAPVQQETPIQAVVESAGPQLGMGPAQQEQQMKDQLMPPVGAPESAPAMGAQAPDNSAIDQQIAALQKQLADLQAQKK
jgi:hypothetical protein